MADKLTMMFSEETITNRIKELGKQITQDYKGKELHIVCVLKGASFFACELAKRIDLPVYIDFISVSSYGAHTESSGIVKIVKDLDEPLKDEHVLVVEDIVDTGRTLRYLIELLKDRHPASLSLCALLDKPDRRVVDISADYTGFEIPDKFIVGYGLDYAQKYRCLPYIAEIEPDMGGEN